jgi:hypothetical protein
MATDRRWGCSEVTGKQAAIGAMKDLQSIICGEAGTTITVATSRIEWAP